MYSPEDLKKVTVRKGSGKAHRALQYPNGSVSCVCGCPGTQNGSLANRAAIIAQGWERSNCRKTEGK